MENAQQVRSAAIGDKLGVIERPDGFRQATYDSIPLYYYAPDTAPLAVTGHGFNNVWFVVHEDRVQMTVQNPVVRKTTDDELGEILMNQGFTLYYFENDEPGKSNCNGGCATAWPPLLVDDGGTAKLDNGIAGTLGTITRDDGTTQVTYNDLPLYFYAPDTFPGDTKGQGFNDVWFVVEPKEASDPSPQPKVIISEHPVYGRILTSASGRVIYLFTNDEPNQSNCVDGCADLWPPVPMPAGETPIGGEGVTGALGTIARADGITQVTYEGMPLYYYAPDTDPLAATGHGVNNVWFLVHADRGEMDVKNPVVRKTTDPVLGDILMNQGFTLYYFKNDEQGKSNCNDGCATAWPPLLVGDGGTPKLDDGLPGKLGTITRDDGTTQVTYNDLPLYFYAPDKFFGDTKGQGFNDVWFVLEPKDAQPPAKVKVTEHPQLGNILTNAAGRTIYIFTNDEPNQSNCLPVDGCSVTWPPVPLADGEALVGGQGVSGQLGTITRDDGTTQVTYNRQPLYYYAPDTQLGDAKGQGVGNVWFVVNVSSSDGGSALYLPVIENQQ